MLRSRRVRRLAALLLLAGLANCSKKSAGPTTPQADPACNLSPGNLDFGTVTGGSSADLQFTLTNTGAGVLSGTVSADTSTLFAVVGNGAYNLSAGQTATFTIRFSPHGPGSASCSINTGSALCARVACSATSQVGTPVCAVTPSTLGFGSVPIGSSAEQSFDLGNTGGGILSGTVTASSLDYSVINPTFNLAAGAHGPIRVQFNPSNATAVPCTLSVGGIGCPPVISTGRGFLETHDHCSVAVTSGIVDFGEVSVGHTAEALVTLKNFSTDYLADGVVLENCPEFTNGIGSYTLAPGTSITGTVRFTPARVGSQECTMPINCWMDGSGTNPGVQSAITCRGVGVGGTPVCLLSTTHIDFGSVEVGQTSDLSFTVTNAGTGPLSGVAGPSHCPEFTFLEPTAYSLSPGQSATLTLRFAPGQVGHTITCSLMPVGLDCPALEAVGAAVGPPTCALSVQSLDFGDVPVGQTRDLTFDISNAGGGTLCDTVTEISPELSIVENASYCVTAPNVVRVTVRYSPTSTGSIFADIRAGGGCPRLTARGMGI